MQWFRNILSEGLVRSGASSAFQPRIRSANRLKFPFIITVGAVSFAAECLRHEPWLEWSGKREKPWFEVEPVALHMHERILDTEYDGRTFCICQAFLPDKTKWAKLAKALGDADVIEEDAFEALSGLKSLPFPRPERLGKGETWRAWR